ncbi:MAG: hypothetical protein WEB52_02095 [Dehalococcoidia bacterium]
MVNEFMLSACTWAQALKTAAIAAVTPEDGQDIMEYAVLAGGIALVLGFVLFVVGDNFLLAAFETFAEEIEACVTFDPACGN